MTVDPLLIGGAGTALVAVPVTYLITQALHGHRLDRLESDVTATREEMKELRADVGKLRVSIERLRTMIDMMVRESRASAGSFASDQEHGA